MKEPVFGKVVVYIRHWVYNPRRASVWTGVVTFAATSLASLLNYAFNLAMGRMLGPDEYSVMSALLGMYVVVSVPVMVVNTVVAKRVSERMAVGRPEEVGGIVWATWRSVVLYGGGTALLLLILSPWLARFLQVDNAGPVVAMISILLPTLVLFVARGCLQGAQWFGALAANTVLEGVLRLGTGIALATLGLGASGGLLALTCSVTGMVALAVWVLRPFLQTRRAADQESGQARYLVFTLAGYLAFTVLTNADVVFVRHFFSPQTAGEYAAVATLGKIVLFFPASVATVMFPTTARRSARQQETVGTLGKSAVVTLALCAIPIAGMFALAQPLLRLSYGNAYTGGAGLLGVYGATMGVYALVSLLLQYFLSVDDMRFVIALATGAVLFLLGIGIFHGSMAQVVGVVGIVGGLMAGIGFLLSLLPADVRRTV